LTKMNADSRREQVQYALAIFGNKPIHKNQSLNSRGLSLHYTANNHAGVTVPYKSDIFELRYYLRNVVYVLAQRSVRRKPTLVSTETAEDRRYGCMPLLFEQRH